jgi:hypothetical protein
VAARVRCTGGSSLGSRVRGATLPFCPRTPREGGRRFDRPVLGRCLGASPDSGAHASNQMSAGLATTVTLGLPLHPAGVVGRPRGRGPAPPPVPPRSPWLTYVDVSGSASSQHPILTSTRSSMSLVSVALDRNRLGSSACGERCRIGTSRQCPALVDDGDGGARAASASHAVVRIVLQGQSRSIPVDLGQESPRLPPWRAAMLG